jgi:predicted transposase/invertase (TIGR01784 family)
LWIIGKTKKQKVMEQKDRYIRFDWAVKRLLRNKANFGVLEGFLTVLLGESIRIVEILESEGNQQRENEKFNRVDIKARNSKDEIIIVEVQNTREIYYLERILFGVAKAITEHIELGELYSEVKKVYSVSILYFDIGKGNDYLYHGQNSFVGVHTGDFLEVTTKEKDAIVRKLPAEIFPEYFLIRVNEFNKVAVTPLEEWIEYLKTGIIRPDTKAPGLEEARRKLIYYNMDRAEQLAYDEHINAVMIQNDVLSTAAEEGRQEGRQEGWQKGMQEGREEGMQEGRKEGREEGREERNVENARTMKSLNISSEVIHQVTGLSIKDIEGL